MVSCRTYSFTRHSTVQMFERKISVKNVKTTVKSGEVIQSYPDDKPYPSFLILAFINKDPIHVVVAINKQEEHCIIVTAYKPSGRLWSSDFRTRK